MKVRLSRQFQFEASHALSHLPASHPCHSLHGHSYGVSVEVSGDVDEASGFLVDYADIHKAVKPIIDVLDHRHLNDVEGLKLATTEFIAKYLWDRVKPRLPGLCRITISETGSTQCTYEGE
jgi:6-pyruvoyltetrahydropterin/6-carboxytetrahydropterin synthase